MSKRRWLFTAIVAVVVVAAGTGWLVWQHSGDTSAAGAPAAIPSTAPLTTDRATTLSADLAAGTDDRMADAVALPPGQALTAGAAQEVSALTPVTFDVATFHDNGDGSATVVAHLAHPAAGTDGVWLVHLVSVAGQWKISLTESQ